MKGLQELQDKIGADLPEDYVDFLRSNVIDPPTPIFIDQRVDGEDVFQVDKFLTLSDSDDYSIDICASCKLLNSEYKDIWDAVHADCKLPIAWDPGSNVFILLKLNAVWEVNYLYLDVDVVSSNGQGLEMIHIASSFSAFYKSLKHLDVDDYI